MKGVAPPDVTIKEICYAAMPFIMCDMIAMALIIVWPPQADQVSGVSRYCIGGCLLPGYVGSNLRL